MPTPPSCAKAIASLASVTVSIAADTRGIFNGILTGQSETYSLLIDTYIKDSQEKGKLFKAIDNFPCIKKKADWSVKWINDKRSNFATRLEITKKRIVKVTQKKIFDKLMIKKF